MESQRNPDIVKAAWILGLSILLSAIILGVGAIFVVGGAASTHGGSVERAAERTAKALDGVTHTVGRTFGEPLQLEVGTTVAMPQPVTVQGTSAEGAIPINTDIFSDNDDQKKGDGD